MPRCACESTSNQATVYSYPASLSSDKATNSSSPANGIASMRTAATGIRRSAISAQVMSPVSPSPPTVAWKSRSSGVISRASPSERSSSSRRTCAPNVPARWWFFPWMSLAIAPPTDTCLVPGTTGRKNPRGTISRKISPRVTPASQRSRPEPESKEMKRSSPSVRRSLPPSFRQQSP